MWVNVLLIIMYTFLSIVTFNEWMALNTVASMWSFILNGIVVVLNVGLVIYRAIRKV